MQGQIEAPGGHPCPFASMPHLTWTTFARLPLIDAAIAAFLEKFLVAECQRQGARMLAVGIVRDHVHLLIELPAAFNVPRLVQGLKGASARIANRDRITQHESLRWAQGYDLPSVGPRQLGTVEGYVRNQASYHGEQQRLGKATAAATRPVRFSSRSA